MNITQSISQFIILFLLSTLLWQCKSGNNKSVKNKTNTNQTTPSKISKDPTKSLPSTKTDETSQKGKIDFKSIEHSENKKKTKVVNDDKSLTLVYTIIKKVNDPATIFDCIVYRNSDNKKVHEGRYRGVKIGWHNTTSLQLTNYVGIIQKETIPQDTNTPTKFQNNLKIIKLNL